MLYIQNDFIGSGNANSITPADPVVHKYNSNGHRTKQVEELDTNNYILFAGCSHTEGTGLEIDEIYTHFTSEMLGMDYYNMGIRGSGSDVMMHNLMTWLFKYEHKPKLIILQWSFQLRYARLHDDLDPNHLETEGSWSSEDFARFSILGERVKYFSLRNTLYYKLSNQIKIPTIHISFPEYNNKSIENYIEFDNLGDRAKDNEHMGPVSHKNLASKIVKYIKDSNIL